MSRLRVGIDVDGVLADFNMAFFGLLNKNFGLTEFRTPCWNWPQALGLTDAQVAQAWELLSRELNWWLEKPQPCEGTDNLWGLALEHECFFITSRVPTYGASVAVQTAKWLYQHFDVQYATVIVEDNKAPLVKVLNLDYFIDDKPTTVDAVATTCKARSYVLDAPWNKDAKFAYKRVKTFNAYADDILGA